MIKLIKEILEIIHSFFSSYYQTSHRKPIIEKRNKEDNTAFFLQNYSNELITTVVNFFWKHSMTKKRGEHFMSKTIQNFFWKITIFKPCFEKFSSKAQEFLMLKKISLFIEDKFK